MERVIEAWLLRSRWLLAPLYVGLVIALLALVVAFCKELVGDLAKGAWDHPGPAIMMILSLIDLSLTGNLVLIVIISGYENFISKMTLVGRAPPTWMGQVDFLGLKIKLMATIAAISGIAVLRAFTQLTEDNELPDRHLLWLVVIHLMFVASGVLMALTGVLMGMTRHRHED
jgi:uncharacterized protein (TIGR00645 family)